MTEPADITVMLNDWMHGDAGAMEQLAPLIYKQLHHSARRAFAGESDGNTLQPTALVNEVFLNLVDLDVPWQNRAHFYALSARMMRRLLINHARERNTEKRGGKVQRVEFTENSGDDQDSAAHYADLLSLNMALEELGRQDKRKLELLELQYFAGLGFREMAEVTGLSTSTLDRELRFARTWLKTRLGDSTPG